MDNNTPAAQASEGSTSHRDPEVEERDWDAYCAVCMDSMKDKETLSCSHSFCAVCIASVLRVKPVCPLCNSFLGTVTGTQPRDGVMSVARSWQRLPGFEDSQGTIVIEYRFPAGVQGPEHPNPGIKYAGTSRTAFLPACDEGERVLKLLQKAFERRLVFTIGTSVTTGISSAITWNDIHHKTSPWGGPEHFGYPDPDYLYRVQEELRLKGLTD